MKYFIYDHAMDITCSTGELFTMHERGQRIYGELSPTGNQTRIMQPYIAERPRYHYDPVLATWEDFNAAWCGDTGYVTITLAHDPQRPPRPARNRGRPARTVRVVPTVPPFPVLAVPITEPPDGGASPPATDEP